MKLKQYSLRRLAGFAEFEWVIFGVNRDDLCKIVCNSYLYFYLKRYLLDQYVEYIRNLSKKYVYGRTKIWCAYIEKYFDYVK